MNDILLGKGGFGFVVKFELEDGTFAAKKTLKLTQFEDDNIELKRRFKREVEYQQSFDHPNIVKIISADLAQTPPYFVMPLATCQLGKEAENGINLVYADKVNAFAHILKALQIIHQQGHVHRDIKPANILRFDHPNGSYHYAVSDFGLIAPSDRDDTTSITSTHAAMGTEFYMAPECFRFGMRSATEQSDIYSLGVLLLFLCKEDNDDLGYPYEQRFSSGIWGNIINKCTQRDPQDRYASVDGLEEDFNIVFANMASK